MRKMIAKTIEGQEFIYSRASAHSVPVSSAAKICKALNDARYNLKAGECWHVYEAGQYELDYTSAGYNRFFIRNGRIMEGRC